MKMICRLAAYGSLLLLFFPGANALAKTSFPVSQAQMRALGIDLITLRTEKPAHQVYPALVTLPTDQESVVSAPVSGLVSTILIQPNQRVQKGQALLRLNSPELTQMQLQLLQASSQATLAKQVLAREQSLQGEGIIAMRRVNEAQARLAEATATVAQAQAALRLAGMSSQEIHAVVQSGQLRDALTVHAARDGTVLALKVSAGQRVMAADALLHLGNIGKLWLDIQVPVADAEQWPTGTPVTLVGRPIRGRVIGINPMVSTGNQTLVIRALLERPGTQIRPGEFVQVRVSARQPSGSFNVPLSALARDAGKTVLFVHHRTGFEARPVQVLSSVGQTANVRGKLKAGEQVASKGVIALKSVWLGEWQGEGQ